MSTGRTKKNKLKPRSGSRENDPAYTEDVRHLALPRRRNSGPEIPTRGLRPDVFSKMDFSSSGGNNSEPLRMKKAKKKRGIYEKIGQYMATASNKSNNNYDEYRIYENSRSLRNICMESSSDEGLEATGLAPVTSRQRTGRSERGKSLDYGQIDDKKRLSWFHRESRSTEHTLSRPLKEQKRKHHTLDRTEKYVIEHLRNKLQKPGANSSSQEWDPRENRHQFESDVYARTEERKRYLSSGRSADDLLSVHEGTKSKKSGKLQIGRRFLRGEIGIKSFNYYLIKEGLKSTTTPKNANPEKGPFKSQDAEIKGDEKNSNDQQRKYKEFPSRTVSGEGYKGRKTSRAGGAVEENIYEEIFFRDRDLRKGDAKATAKHHRHSHSVAVVTGGSMGRMAARRGETGGEGSWKFRDDCEICTQQEQQCANANCEICNANCGLRKRSDSSTKRSKSSNPKARLTLDFNTDEDGDGDEDTDAVYARIRRGGGGGGERGIFVNKYAETGSHYSRIVPRQDMVMDVGLEHDDDDVDKEVNKAQPYVPAQQPVLQFQSYNPNNPGVFKIETTPIAVSNYNPFDAKMCVDSPYQSAAATTTNVQNIYQEIRHINAARGKSSSSSDSLTHSRNMSRRTGESLKQDVAAEDIYSKPRQRRTNAVIYKTPSEASMLSEDVRGGGGQHLRMAGDMSDSSIGDSLFSCSNQRRYFGSSESCRLGSDCQRCLERCNYYSEDNKNYCCDCSSSYFSSDFDENPNGGVFNRNMSTRVSVQSNPATATDVPHHHQQQNQHHQQYDNYYDYPKKAKKSSAKCEPGYGEEFMRHVIHVRNTTSFGEDDSHYSKPKSNTPREMGSSGGGGGLRATSSSTTKAMMATEQAEIRNRDAAARKDSKKNVKKKYYYDDIMTIPNEVAYNLSYGMIRRENKARDVPEREKAEAEDQSQPSFARDDGFRIYEEIKERNPEPPTTAATGRTKQRDEPNYATSRPIDVKETGAKPKVISAPSGHHGDDEIPTMQIMKKSQPIYASPVKVKRIPAAEKRPVDEVALQLAKSNTDRDTTIESGRTLSGSRPSEQREKSNFDTSLKEEDVHVPVHSIDELKTVGQTNWKHGQNQSTEWKTEKYQSNNNLADEEINPNGTEDDKRRSPPSSKCVAVGDQKCPEIAEDCSNVRPRKGSNAAVSIPVAALDVADTSRMSPEKALGISRASVDGCVSAEAEFTATIGKIRLAANDESKINQTHNENVNEKNINPNPSSSKESAVQEQGLPLLSESSSTRAEYGKSTVSKAEKSFSGDTRTTASSAAPQQDNETVKESAREPKRADAKSIPQQQSAKVVAPEKALARDKAPVASPLVSVELSKRAVQSNSSRDEDGGASVSASACEVKSSNATIAAEPIKLDSKDKVVIATRSTTETPETGDKCRSTDCEPAERTKSNKNNEDFLDTDISDLPLPDLPAVVKKLKRRVPASTAAAREERGQSETLTSTEETFVTATSQNPTPQTLSAGSSRTPTKVKRVHHTRNSSLPRSFRQRNEARAGYLLRRQQRLKTSSAEDLLSFEKRTMNSGRMHYGSQVDKPRYLFGETATLHSGLGKSNGSGSRHYLSDDKHASQDFDNEIFLNKSGWVQVKQRASMEGGSGGGSGNGASTSGRSSRFDNNNSTSKLEDLMLRNEARRNVAMQNFYQKGYLPVVRNAFGKIESPPPMTPIISPPPAFQDAASAAAAAAGGGVGGSSKVSVRIGKQQQQQMGSRVHLTVSDADYHHPHHPHRSAINNGNTTSNGNNNNKNISGSNSNGGSGNNSVNNNSNINNGGGGNGKGMVFSRSFEYDNRKMNADYSDVFSKSFEYDLSTSGAVPAVATAVAAQAAGATPTPASKMQQSASLLQIQRERMPAFSNLTGNSPNYLTKKEWGPYRPSILAQQNSSAIPSTATTAAAGSTGLLTSRSRDTSPNQAKSAKPQMYSPATGVVGGGGGLGVVGGGRKAYAAAPVRVSSEKFKAEQQRYQSFDEQVGRSRRAQFSRLRNESSNSSSSRSMDVAAVNRRLNSCDSGARSDLSNDEEDDEDPSSSLALSYCVPQPSLASSTSSIKKQRSLTPDKDIDTEPGQTSFHLNLKKQRSLTPERRTMSLTPEERRKIVAKHATPQALLLRQYEMPKNNAERQKRFEGRLSRSSSSSSYSGDENRQRRGHAQSGRQYGSNKVSSNNVTSSNNSLDSGDHRIRRSRSLQLTERSPNTFAVQAKPPQQMQPHPSPNRRRHRSPIDYGDYDSSLGEDPYSKSRSFDEDYASGYKKSSRAEIPNPRTQKAPISKRSYSNDRSLDYGRRLYEHNLICASNDPNTLFPNSSTGPGQSSNANYRNRSPLMMQFRPEQVANSVNRSRIRDRSPVSGDEPEELDENEQFYHLKKLLSNANLQNNKNYQYTKSKSAKRHPLQSSESLAMADSLHFVTAPGTTSRNRSPMLSKRTESLQSAGQSSAMFKGRAMKAEGRRPGGGNLVAVTANSALPPPPALSSGSCTSTSSCGIEEAKSLRATSSKSLDSLADRSSHPRRCNSQNEVRGGVVATNAKSMERTKENPAWDNNYITNIDVTAATTAVPNKDNEWGSDTGFGAFYSEHDECFMGYDIYNARPGRVQQWGRADDNEVVYGVVPMPNNNVKIVLRKPQAAIPPVAVPLTAAMKQKPQKNVGPVKQGSIVQIKHSVPYCCSGKELRSNDIRIVVNHRRLRNRMKHPRRVLTTNYRSRSLPTLIMRRYTSPEEEQQQKQKEAKTTINVDSVFVPTNQLQLRAVSSPSLSENASERKQNKKSSQNGPSESVDTESEAAASRATADFTHVDDNCATVVEVLGNDEIYETARSHTDALGSINQHGGEESGQNGGQAGVLQKFRKTLSHLKGKPPTNPPQEPMNEITITTGSGGSMKTHRFGPLVWRTSKERRKAKHQRRDKCNSGDSGIHVELENDDMHLAADGGGGGEGTATVETRNVHVRRTNSAKTGKSAATKHRERMAEETDSGHPSLERSVKGRSLSQPSDLNRLPDEEIDSDSDSITEDEDEEPAVLAEVIFPFQPGGPQELALPKGAIVEVLKRDAGPWWWGRIKNEAGIIDSEADLLQDDRHGWFPKDFVRIIYRSSPMPNTSVVVVNQALGHGTDAPTTGGSAADSHNASPNGDSQSCSSQSTTASPVNSEAMRENVIKELLETEINYVKLLSSLCSGFLAEFRDRPEIFPSNSLDMIFSNVEEILQFQQSFLEGLTHGIKTGQIAQAFLKHQSKFMVYSNYCNSYTRALNELDKYAQNKEALLLLESCRQREALPELPLQAHLLAPIQRICKYPLHLMELVKHSPTRAELMNGAAELEDCKEIFECALAAMRRVTEMVNEGKRNSEYLARLQQKFESFKGPPLNVHSTRLFLQIDAIRMSPNLWNNTYTLFLFDRQLVMVKKDLLKRNHFLFKGRIFLDSCRVLNLPNGKMFGVTLKNALRVYCDIRGKWYDFCFRSFNHKLRFLNMLAVERQFCGKSLFLSELAGNVDAHQDEEELADGQMVVNYHNDFGMLDHDHDAENYYDLELIDNIDGVGGTMKPPPPDYKKLNKKYNSETLPKKSKRQVQMQQHEGRQPMHERQQQALGRIGSTSSGDYNTASLGRGRRIGNWFRKAKSTNTTPSHSPTHQMHEAGGAVQASTTSLISDSSAENSPSMSRGVSFQEAESNVIAEVESTRGGDGGESEGQGAVRVATP